MHQDNSDLIELLGKATKKGYKPGQALEHSENKDFGRIPMFITAIFVLLIMAIMIYVSYAYAGEKPVIFENRRYGDPMQNCCSGDGVLVNKDSCLKDRYWLNLVWDEEMIFKDGVGLVIVSLNRLYNGAEYMDVKKHLASIGYIPLQIVVPGSHPATHDLLLRPDGDGSFERAGIKGHNVQIHFYEKSGLVNYSEIVRKNLGVWALKAKQDTGRAVVVIYDDPDGGDGKLINVVFSLPYMK